MNPKKRVTNNLVALGSAAVIAVYSAGYVRTRSAAAMFAGEDAERRPAVSTGGAAPAREAASESPVAESRQAAAPAQVAHTAPARSRPPVADSTKATDSASVTPAVPAPTPVPVPASIPVAVPARDSATATVVSQAADSAPSPAEKEKAPYRDGNYTGWGTSRHGDIQATVETKGGRIVNAYISICNTRYSCSVISALPPQVVVRQSPDVDFVSGATQSTNAFYYAVVEALSKAK